MWQWNLLLRVLRNVVWWGQACYSLASAQRRSRAADSGQQQPDEHALHMDASGPVFHDMQQVLVPMHLLGD